MVLDVHDLRNDAQGLGCRIEYRNPNNGLWGAYHHDRRLIILKPDLGRIQHTYVLAHEIAHAYHSHDGWNLKFEAVADKWAAEHLIDYRALKDIAHRLPSLSEAAATLDVLPSTLKTYLNHLHPARKAELNRLITAHAA